MSKSIGYDLILDKQEGITRRGFFGVSGEFLKMVGSGLVGYTIGGVLDGTGVGNQLKAKTNKIIERFNDPLDGVSRNEIFESLFLPHGNFHIATATEKIQPGHEVHVGDDQYVKKKIYTHSNEALVIKALRAEMGAAAQVIESDWYDVTSGLNADLSFVALGGPITNWITRQVIGSPDILDTAVNFSTDILDANGNKYSYQIPLEYTIKKVSSEDDVSTIRDGKVMKHFRYEIFDRNSNLVARPEYKNGKVETDYLLVTRVVVPGHLGEIISFAGLHGPSIRSIKNLMTSLERADLLFLKNKISKHNTDPMCFQTIIRAYDMKDEIVPKVDKEATTTPRQIAIHKSKASEFHFRQLEYKLRRL